MDGDEMSRNGAHGLCLQLGGLVEGTKCSFTRNKQSGAAIMGVGTIASLSAINSTDNGIDGVHVGQGADLTLSDSVIERSRRIGVSALGRETKAQLRCNRITSNGEHGIAQSQGACVHITDNKLEGNEGGDMSGNIIDTRAAAIAAGKEAQAKGLPEDVVAMLVREDTPLFGKSRPRRSLRVEEWLGILVVLGALVAFLYWWWLRLPALSPAAPLRAIPLSHHMQAVNDGYSKSDPRSYSSPSLYLHHHQLTGSHGSSSGYEAYDSSGN